MTPSLLGKKVIPRTPAPKPVPKSGLSLIICVIAPLVVILAGIWAIQMYRQAFPPFNRHSASNDGFTRTLALTPPTSGTGGSTASGSSTDVMGPPTPEEAAQAAQIAADATAAKTARLNAIHPCDRDELLATSPDFVNNIFPLLPQSILSPVDGNEDRWNKFDPTQPASSTNLPPSCTPTYWGLPLMNIMAYKVFSILTWLAGALAVILTVYAGLLFIGGFAKEENVKTAKRILIVTYTGLLIVVGSKIILYGTIQLFGNTNDIHCLNENIYNDPTAPATATTPAATTPCPPTTTRKTTN